MTSTAWSAFLTSCGQAEQGRVINLACPSPLDTRATAQRDRQPSRDGGEPEHITRGEVGGSPRSAPVFVSEARRDAPRRGRRTRPAETAGNLSRSETRSRVVSWDLAVGSVAWLGP